MELRDYLGMLRRGWPTVLILLLVSVALAGLYVVTTPKQYSTSSVIVISPKNPKTFTDLQQGSQFTVDRASTFAQIIDSQQVLGGVAKQLNYALTVDQLEGKVLAGSRMSTSIIDISVTAGSAAEAESIANATATVAAQVIPNVSLGKSGSSTLVTVDVLRKSTPALVTVSPRSTRIIAIGFVVGLALGLALAVARQALDTKLRLPADVQRLALGPLLAVVPRPTRRQRSGVLVRDDPAALAGESYRSLRTIVSDTSARSRGSLLVVGISEEVTSAQVAVNLAWSIAQAGREVLFVDLDMRHSPSGAMLGLHGDPGMADVLTGNAELDDVIHETSHPLLYAAMSGTAHQNPSDLISSKRMEQSLTLAEGRYEFVVLHAPPLLRFTDAAVVAMFSAQTLVAVSAGRTRTAELTEAVGVLRNVRVDPVGFVLCGTRGIVGKMQWLLRTTGRPARSSAAPLPPAKVSKAERTASRSAAGRSPSAREPDRTTT